MRYLVMGLEDFYKRFSEEFHKGMREIYGDKAPKSSISDFRYFFHNAVVNVVMEKDIFVGAICSLMNTSPMVPGGPYAGNLFLFVNKPWRNSLVPGKLMKLAEDTCKEAGCKNYFWEVEANSPLIPALEKRARYRKSAVIYQRELIV